MPSLGRNGKTTISRKTAATAAIVVVAGLIASAAQPQMPSSLAPDLVIEFNCAEAASPRAERAIEEFLAGREFRVLNRARAFERHGLTPLSAFEIIAINGQARIVEFGEYPVRREGRYFTRLRTRPPTVRAVTLEDALLAFVENELNCTVVEVRRSRNEADARDFFDFIYSMYEGWFRQLEEMEKRRP